MVRECELKQKGESYRRRGRGNKRSGFDGRGGIWEKGSLQEGQHWDGDGKMRQNKHREREKGRRGGGEKRRQGSAKVE